MKQKTKSRKRSNKWWKRTLRAFNAGDKGRNDVGKVSEINSVNVTQSFEIEKYSHVMHIVSHVTGKLSDDLDCFDALKSAFQLELSQTPK